VRIEFLPRRSFSEGGFLTKHRAFALRLADRLLMCGCPMEITRDKESAKAARHSAERDGGLPQSLGTGFTTFIPNQPVVGPGYIMTPRCAELIRAAVKPFCSWSSQFLDFGK
jgi:hypothetical protein